MSKRSLMIQYSISYFRDLLLTVIHFNVNIDSFMDRNNISKIQIPLPIKLSRLNTYCICANADTNLRYVMGLEFDMLVNTLDQGIRATFLAHMINLINAIISSL